MCLLAPTNCSTSYQAELALIHCVILRVDFVDSVGGISSESLLIDLIANIKSKDIQLGVKSELRYEH